VNTRPVNLKFVVFCPKFTSDSNVKFLKKNILREYFRNFVQTKAIYPLPNLVKFCPIFCNFFLGPYYAEKIYTSTFMSCLNQGKEAHP